MRAIFVLVAALAVTQGTTAPRSNREALAVPQESTTPPSNRESSLRGHSVNSLLYSALQATGFTDSCVTGQLDFCSLIQVRVKVLYFQCGRISYEYTIITRISVYQFFYVSLCLLSVCPGILNDWKHCEGDSQLIKLIFS